MAVKRAAKNAQAIASAQQRRKARASQQEVEIEWFVEKVSSTVALTMKQRVAIATQFLETRVVRNISRPVTKTSTKIAGRQITRVANRSKKGEFPKADTTQLMKSIFKVVRQTRKGVFDGFIGTTLDYGLILEISKRLDRSFLVRTLNENKATITKILTGPIK